MRKFTHIKNFLEGFRGEVVFVGFSGGADSIALLLLLTNQKIPVQVIHFEHGIRGAESCDDARFAEQFCRARNIPCRVIPLNVPEQRGRGENLESAARRLRLEAWKKIVPQGGVVALGHHRNDAVENLLMRFARGGNVSSLVNLKMEKTFDTLRIIRPMLSLFRSEVESFLRENGVFSWCEDCTNADGSYQRNFLRNNVIKPWTELFDPAAEGFSASLDALAMDADFIDTAAKEKVLQIEESAQTTTEFWQSLHPALLPRVLKGYLKNNGGLTAGVVVSFEAFVSSPHSGRFAVSGCEFKKERGILTLQIENQPENQPETLIWNWKKYPVLNTANGEFSATFSIMPIHLEFDPFTAWFSPDLLPDVLDLAPRVKGERYRAFDGSEKTVKKLFINSKLTAEKKNTQLILRAAKEILWIPSLANTANYSAEPGKKSVKLTFKPN